MNKLTIHSELSHKPTIARLILERKDNGHIFSVMEFDRKDWTFDGMFVHMINSIEGEYSLELVDKSHGKVVETGELSMAEASEILFLQKLETAEWD